MQDDPLFRRIRQHAEKRLAFADAEDDAARLAMLKEFVRLEDEMLKRYHGKGDSGLRVTRARAIVMDVIIENLHARAIARCKNECSKVTAFSILANGGYGRGELNPHSDVDLMFLHPVSWSAASGEEQREIVTREILYPLWDTGFKVGHSSRTWRDALSESKRDERTRNALLDSRRICGSRRLADKFLRKFRRYLSKDNPARRLQELWQGQKARRKEYGGTVFIQTPDIKNGVGGLRDYQGILWMACIKFAAPGLKTLVEKKYILEGEAKALREAYSFLLRVRNELHFQSKRPVDVLYLENQPEIARALGYCQEDLVERVESFMGNYYGHARTIYETSKVVGARFAEDFSRPGGSLTFRSVLEAYRKPPTETVDGFELSGKLIDATTENIFEQDPNRLIRLFRHCQRFEAKPSFGLRALVRHSLHLIDSRTIHSPAANKTFRAILQNAGFVFPTLAEMHALGVLGRFTPEFGRLTCKVQHEFYHRYTADAHVLATLRELDKVFAGEEEIVSKYRDALRKTNVSALLYLMLFLHDLGKADGIKGHSERGVELAEPMLKRMGIEENMRKQVLFMVQNHLEMGRFSMKFDLDDPEVIAAFAAKVEDAQKLHFLYVHTFCDARGTSSDLWNDYKDNLLSQLYRNTLDLLENKQPLAQDQRRETLRETIAAKISDEVPQKEINGHFACLPERYFVHAGEEEIILHLKMAHRLLSAITRSDAEASLVPIVEWRNDLERGFTLVHVVTWDRTGLFYHLAGAFSVTGLNILSSRAVSRSDHVTIDVFIVTGEDGGLVLDDSARHVFEETLDATLVRGENILPLIEKRHRKIRKAKHSKRRDALGATINPSVNVYQEITIDRTIVEIQANDHLGLLFVLARTISKLGFDITFARVSTERSVAIDVFHLESVDPDRLIDSERLLDLRENLNKVVAREEFLISA